MQRNSVQLPVTLFMGLVTVAVVVFVVLNDVFHTSVSFEFIIARDTVTVTLVDCHASRLSRWSTVTLCSCKWVEATFYLVDARMRRNEILLWLLAKSISKRIIFGRTRRTGARRNIHRMPLFSGVGRGSG